MNKSYQKWYQRNKEKKKASSKKWREENPARCKQSSERYRRANRTRINLHHKQLRSQWKESIDSVKVYYGCQNSSCPCPNYYPCELDFHHRDPQQKEMTIAAMGKMSGKRVATEANKCSILCSNCHRRLHAGLLDISLIPICHIDAQFRPIND